MLYIQPIILITIFQIVLFNFISAKKIQNRQIQIRKTAI